MKMLTYIKNLSFRKKLLAAYAGIISISLTIFAMFFIGRFIFTSTQQISISLGDNTNTMAAGIEIRMSEIELLLSAIHSNRIVQDGLSIRHTNAQEADAQNAALLRDAFINSTLFRSKIKWIHIFADSSQLYPIYDKISLHNNFLYSNTTVSDTQWYNNALMANGSTVWNYSAGDEYIGAPSIFVSRSIKKTSNPSSTIGVIRTILNSDFFSNVVLASSAFEGSQAVLFIDGIPVSSHGSDNISDAHFSKLLHTLLDGSGSYAYNAHYMAASCQVRNVPWHVVLVIPTKTLYTSIKPYVATVGFIWLLMLALTLWFSSKLSAHFSTPINTLCNRMLEFGTTLDPYMPVQSDQEIERMYTSFNTMAAKIGALIENEKLAERQRKQAEIRIMQAQINPHFIYNTLESIKALAIKSHATDAVNMITLFGSFLRGSLNNGVHYTTIGGEISHVTSYVEIQKIRFRNAFSFTISISDDILSYLTVNIILQPLVENCITHGFSDIDYQGEIHLDGRLEEGMIILSVSDNGLGADTENLVAIIEDVSTMANDSKYYCLKNVWIRLSGFFKSSSMSFLTNQSGGLTVEMRFEPVTTPTDAQ